MSKTLAPSILSVTNRQEFITELVADGVTWIHYDVMDNTFLPYHALPLPELISLIKNTPPHFVDVHLMVSNPRPYFEALLNQAHLITFHLEAVSAREARALIADFGSKVKIGIAINPETPIAGLGKFKDQLSLVNVMTVNPGRGGQELISTALAKVAELRQLLNQRVLIQVDGGVNALTLNQVLQTPVDVVVSGSYVASELKKGPKTLKALLKQISDN